MATNKVNLRPDNLTEWLASTGFLFPRNELELTRYNKVYEDSNAVILNDSSVSIERILAGKCRELPSINPFEETDIKNIETHYRMVARNGQGIPDHILKKMKKNQDDHDNGLSEKADK